MTDAIDEHFLNALGAPGSGRLHPLPDGLPGDLAVQLFDAQLGSRHLDLAARYLAAEGTGFYSIGSSGHEGNAALAAALRSTDPALLHYRSGGFYLQRANQLGGGEDGGDGGDGGLRDVLLGITAAAEEPIAGGRHKVFGNKALHIIPQTSTIASHLPRAVGVAFGIERAAKLGLAGEWPPDAIAVCSFGDASANHSTATGAINTALHCAYQGLPMPLLLVCEDNGIGISVRTPTGWIEAAYGQRPGLRYFTADGWDLAQTLEVARRAADWVRTRRAPAFLRLRTVRLMGHAGSDVESAYRRAAEIAADQTRDPVLHTARLLVGAGVLSAKQVLDRYENTRQRVRRLATDAAGRRRLASVEEVLAPLAPSSPAEVARHAWCPAAPAERDRVFEQRLPESEGGLTLAQSVNRALTDLLASDPGTVVFGEDVANKGGVYGVTKGLAKRFGAARVYDSLLDEQSILGTGLGMSLSGFLPIVEVQYLAYLHNAADQLRGEAATLRFFSQGQYRNPMVVRIAGLAYQRGFGGHFHNDNAVAALRDIPGLVVAAPGRPDDAAAMLRSCAAAARVDGRVCVFLEPIALYHTRDLHRDDDGGWLADYPDPTSWAEAHVPLGAARTYGEGKDLTLVSFANGLRMSLRVARRLTEQGIGVRVVDLRWLAPLPMVDVLREAEATGRVLVVDETRSTGGVAEPVLAGLVDAGFTGRLARVASADSFVPLGPAAGHVLLSEQDVEKAARELLEVE